MHTESVEVSGLYNGKKETKTLSSLKVQMKDQISIYSSYSFILKMFIKHLSYAKDLAMNNTDLAPFSPRTYAPVGEIHS